MRFAVPRIRCPKSCHHGDELAAADQHLGLDAFDFECIGAYLLGPLGQTLLALHPALHFPWRQRLYPQRLPDAFPTILGRRQGNLGLCFFFGSFAQVVCQTVTLASHVAFCATLSASWRSRVHHVVCMLHTPFISPVQRQFCAKSSYRSFVTPIAEPRGSNQLPSGLAVFAGLGEMLLGRD